MKTILLRYYSAANLGDDLFVKLISERYKNKFSIITYRESKTLNELPNLDVHKGRAKSAIMSYIEYRFGKKIWLEYLATRCDLMVYIGGSIFWEDNNLQLWRGEEKFYKKLKIPYYFVGSNFGPYKTPEFKRIVHSIIKGARDICFRDKASFELFKSLPNVRVASDIVFMLDVSKYTIKTEKRVIFSIIDCERLDKEIVQKYEQEIINLTSDFAKKGYEIVYMSFCKLQGDEKACERVKSKITERKICDSILIYSYEGDLDEALLLLSSCEVVIGTRFHATILGLLFGKKVLPINYSGKTREALKDMGFTGQTIDLTQPQEIVHIDIQKLAPFSVKRQTIDAAQQFKALDGVLERKTSG